jgi:hypothetical protein
MNFATHRIYAACFDYYNQYRILLHKTFTGWTL